MKKHQTIQVILHNKWHVIFEIKKKTEELFQT